jgi:hypothetical protein
MLSFRLTMIPSQSRSQMARQRNQRESAPRSLAISVIGTRMSPVNTNAMFANGKSANVNTMPSLLGARQFAGVLGGGSTIPSGTYLSDYLQVQSLQLPWPILPSASLQPSAKYLCFQFKYWAYRLLHSVTEASQRAGLTADRSRLCDCVVDRRVFLTVIRYVEV